MNKSKKLLEKYDFLSNKIYNMMIYIFKIYLNDPFLSNIKIKYTLFNS
jgi:hypothetical protein